MVTAEILSPLRSAIMLRVNYYITANMQRILKKAGHSITRDEMAILRILHHDGNMSQTILAERLGKHRNNIPILINKLESENYVMRTPCLQDRRHNILTITSHGSELVDLAAQLLRPWYILLFNKVEDEDALIFNKVLFQLLENAQSSFEESDEHFFEKLKEADELYKKINSVP